MSLYGRLIQVLLYMIFKDLTVSYSFSSGYLLKRLSYTAEKHVTKKLEIPGSLPTTRI